MYPYRFVSLRGVAASLDVKERLFDKRLMTRAYIHDQFRVHLGDVPAAFQGGTYSFINGDDNERRISIDLKRFHKLARPGDLGDQRTDSWCWAASLQMLFAWHSIAVPQEEIVRRTKGAVITQGGSDREIVANLNYWEGKRNGQVVKTVGEIAGLDGGVIAHDLKANNPMLLVVGWKGGSGHVMVITGVTLDQQSGRYIEIEYYDPWPDNEGLQRADPEWFRERTREAFVMRLRAYDL